MHKQEMLLVCCQTSKRLTQQTIKIKIIRKENVISYYDILNIRKVTLMKYMQYEYAFFRVVLQKKDQNLCKLMC